MNHDDHATRTATPTNPRVYGGSAAPTPVYRLDPPYEDMIGVPVRSVAVMRIDNPATPRTYLTATTATDEGDASLHAIAYDTTSTATDAEMLALIGYTIEEPQ